MLSVRVIEYQGEVIARELICDPRALDAQTRMEWDAIHRTWELALHGTRFAYLESIIKKGLLPAVEPGHFRLGDEHFGIHTELGSSNLRVPQHSLPITLLLFG